MPTKINNLKLISTKIDANFLFFYFLLFTLITSLINNAKIVVIVSVSEK